MFSAKHIPNSRLILIACLGLVLSACVVVPRTNHQHGTPHQAPAVQDVFSYWYYPAAGVYYDTRRELYFYKDRGRWLEVRILPPHLHWQLGRHVQVRMQDSRPYAQYHTHQSRYPSAKYRRSEKQNRRHWQQYHEGRHQGRATNRGQEYERGDRDEDRGRGRRADENGRHYNERGESNRNEEGRARNRRGEAAENRQEQRGQSRRERREQGNENRRHSDRPAPRNERGGGEQRRRDAEQKNKKQRDKKRGRVNEESEERGSNSNESGESSGSSTGGSR